MTLFRSPWHPCGPWRERRGSDGLWRLGRSSGGVFLVGFGFGLRCLVGAGVGGAEATEEAARVLQAACGQRVVRALRFLRLFLWVSSCRQLTGGTERRSARNRSAGRRPIDVVAPEVEAQRLRAVADHRLRRPLVARVEQ